MAIPSGHPFDFRSMAFQVDVESSAMRSSAITSSGEIFWVWFLDHESAMTWRNEYIYIYYMNTWHRMMYSHYHLGFCKNRLITSPYVSIYQNPVNIRLKVSIWDLGINGILVAGYAGSLVHAVMRTSWNSTSWNRITKSEVSNMYGQNEVWVLLEKRLIFATRKK